MVISVHEVGGRTGSDVLEMPGWIAFLVDRVVEYARVF